MKAAPEAQAPGPRLSFLNDTLDFGVFNGDSIQQGFVKFTNTGSDTLVIKRISPDCGCTAASVSSFIVPPGQTDSLLIKFDGRGRARGYFKKIVRLRTNAGIRAAFVTGTIRPTFHK